MLTVKVNGIEYKNFISSYVFNSLETISGNFLFEATIGLQEEFPIQLNSVVQILADGTKILTGYVEKMNIMSDVNQQFVSFSGRNKLADFLDSTVPLGREFKGGVSLKGIAQALLNDIGLTDIEVIDNTDGIDVFREDELISAEQDQKCSELLLSFARKRQVYINSNPDGNLILTRGNTGVAPTILQNKINNNGNNIKSFNYEISNQNLYNEYKVVSNLNPSGLEVLFSNEKTSSQEATVIDDTIRSTRKLTIIAEESSDASTCQKRAEWEANIRRADSLKYSAVVQGHGYNSTPWEINKSVHVVDEGAGINSNLLIKSVEMSYDLDAGSQTTLECTYLDAYTLQAQESDDDKKTNKKDDILKRIENVQ